MQEKEDTREVLEFLIRAKKREILTYEENIKKCTEEIKEFENMLAVLEEKN